MHKPLMTLCLTLATLALTACYQNEPPAPGHYVEKVTTKDAAGTKVTKKTSTDVDMDYDGDRTVVKETKTTRNPRGWFNKETTKSTQVYQEESY